MVALGALDLLADAPLEVGDGVALGAPEFGDAGQQHLAGTAPVRGDLVAKVGEVLARGGADLPVLLTQQRLKARRAVARLAPQHRGEQDHGQRREQRRQPRRR
ncbi:MAG: hypothetical protein M5U09_08800 [Gammaproteobacteria bacterium]|nr:hypothetical protein [Gammaproteobacteria bacterium]